MIKTAIPFIALFWCLNSTPVRAAQLNEASKEQPKAGGAVTGSVALSKNCKTGTIELWLSSNRILLYQAEVPPQGTFEFHTVSGKYNLVATSSTGCFVEYVYQIKEGETKNVNLILAPIQSSPKKEIK